MVNETKNNFTRRVPLGLASVLVAVFFWGVNATQADDSNKPFTGERSSWQGGFDRYDFSMDENTLEIQPCRTGSDSGKASARCVVVVPKKALKGKPWSWLDFVAETQSKTEVELLERGFHVAYTTPGTPQQREAWRDFLVVKHGLSKKPIVAGASKGVLKAGSAKVDITPEKTKEPVHDKVHARALVLEIDGERVAFVSVDLKNVYRLTGFMREESGPSGFVPGPRWQTIPVPRGPISAQ